MAKTKKKKPTLGERVTELEMGARAEAETAWRRERDMREAIEARLDKLEGSVQALRHVKAVERVTRMEGVLLDGRHEDRISSLERRMRVCEVDSGENASARADWAAVVARLDAMEKAAICQRDGHKWHPVGSAEHWTGGDADGDDWGRWDEYCSRWAERRFERKCGVCGAQMGRTFAKTSAGLLSAQCWAYGMPAAEPKPKPKRRWPWGNALELVVGVLVVIGGVAGGYCILRAVAGN